MKFTHNPRKKKHCYHIASDKGTICKIENSIYGQFQVLVDHPPQGKRLCGMCRAITDFKGPRSNHAIHDLSRDQMLTTITRLHEGIKPGHPAWSNEDQQCIDVAIAEGYCVTQHFERKTNG